MTYRHYIFRHRSSYARLVIRLDTRLYIVWRIIFYFISIYNIYNIYASPRNNICIFGDHPKSAYGRIMIFVYDIILH